MQRETGIVVGKRENNRFGITVSEPSIRNQLEMGYYYKCRALEGHPSFIGTVGEDQTTIITFIS